MLTHFDEIEVLLAVPTRLCRSCGVVKPSTSFSTDRKRADGLDRRCRSCRKEQTAERRARAAFEDAVPAPAPTGRGPERLEPGAILMALDELKAMPKLVRFEGLDLCDLPRVLRPHAVVGVDGVPVVPRRVLLDWARALRERVGEFRLRGRPEDRSRDEPANWSDALWRHNRSTDH